MYSHEKCDYYHEFDVYTPYVGSYFTAFIYP